jgi:hypothetical protein
MMLANSNPNTAWSPVTRPGFFAALFFFRVLLTASSGLADERVDKHFATKVSVHSQIQSHLRTTLIRLKIQEAT